MSDGATQTAPSAVDRFLAPLAGREHELAGRGPLWLRGLRRAGRERFVTLGFPTTRQEEWRATSVAPIATTAFQPAPSPAPLSVADLPPVARLDLGGPRLVFVDGRHRSELSSTSPAIPGLWLGSLTRALDERPGAVREILERRGAAAGTAFEALGAAFLDDGAAVLIDPGTRLDPPLQLVFLASGRPQPLVSHPWILVALGAGSRACLIESYGALGDGPYLTNAVTDIVVGDAAELDHCRLNLEGPGAHHVAAIGCRQGRDSRLVSRSLTAGGHLTRHDLVARLEGEGAECRLDGLYLPRGEEHVDNHTTLDHARPHGSSRELYKGILSGRSRAVFNGRIIVRPGAQKTDAKQSNRNLLLSNSALAHTRPQLEIHADDVKCTHGATIGRLDDDAIFYLRSRGIERDAARNLLIRAFADEVLEAIPLEPLRALAAGLVAERLPRAGTTTR